MKGFAASLLLFACVVATAQQLPGERRHHHVDKVLLYGWVTDTAARNFDWWSTRRMLSTGAFHEVLLPQWIAGSNARLGIYSNAVPVFYLGVALLFHRWHHLATGDVFPWADAAQDGAIDVHNLALLQSYLNSR